MKITSGLEEDNAMVFLELAARLALQSNCHRWKCGSVIVSNNTVIGKGYNTPPQDCTIEFCLKDELPDNFKSDKTCCLHAEQRAIHDALRRYPYEILGSRIYFTRIDEKGIMLPAGNPYCTICSKQALDVGIAEFVLMHDTGITIYNTTEYNELSFQYREH